MDNCRIVVSIYNFAVNEWGDAALLRVAEALVNSN